MPGPEAGLAEEGGLLVAGHPADRDAGRPARRPPRRRSSRAAHSRAAPRAGPTAARRTGRPARSSQARRSMSKSRVRLALDGSVACTAAAGQPPQQPAVDGAEGQVGPGFDAALGRAARPAWWPRSTGRGPGRCGPGSGPGGRPPRASRTAGAVRRSCQTMARWRGRPRAPVPHDDRLPLVGDADGGDRLVERRPAASARVAATAAQISSGVVLHPTGPGEVLRELPVAGSDRRAVRRRPPWPGRRSSRRRWR